MQGGRSNRDPFLDGFDDAFGGFGGFRGHRSLFSGVFGGRDPFDDPFFTQPFGSMFGSSIFSSAGSPFTQTPTSGFLEHQVTQPNKPRGPVIEEIYSDDEREEEASEKMDKPRKHRRQSKEPYVEDPDDETEERKSKHVQNSNNAYNRIGDVRSQPQTRSFTYQSSSVTYGGANRAYYTSSTRRRGGSDGLTIEESKEADTSSGQAKHRISRGIQDKGHSVTRKLNSDGRVDTMQTLHNLNEDELTGFEDAWNVKASKNLAGWPERFSALDSTGHNNDAHNARASRGGWALPSTETSSLQASQRTPANNRHRKTSKGRH